MDSGINIQLARAKLEDSLRDAERPLRPRCPASTARAPADAARDGVSAQHPLSTVSPPRQPFCAAGVSARTRRRRYVETVAVSTSHTRGFIRSLG
jgi:hypothetical protein